MKVAFRVDSSLEIGSGHLMRCLSLASRLKEHAEIVFVARDLVGNLNFLIKEYGELIELPQAKLDENLSGYEQWLTVKPEIDAQETKEALMHLSIDCLIIDHYAIDETWEKVIRPYINKIMVIDDLANRRHDCDLLLDQGAYKNPYARYRNLVPPECRLFMGLDHLLLRREFYIEKARVKERKGQVKDILVFFGGSDKTNETMKALRALRKIGRNDIAAHVVVGASNPNKSEVERFCRESGNMRYNCQISHMAELMNRSDLAIGGGGMTIWERCYLELPSLVVYMAENQRVKWDMEKPFIELGWHEDVGENEIIFAVNQLLRHPELAAEMVQRCRAMFGGNTIWEEECKKWINIL